MTKLLYLISLLTYVARTQLESNTFELSSTIAALSRGLGSQTNIIHTESNRTLDVCQQISQIVSEVPSFLVRNNAKSLVSICGNLPAPVLLIISHSSSERTMQIFKQLPINMQKSDFLLIGRESASSWFELLTDLWHLGYPNIIFYNSTHGGMKPSLDIYGTLYTAVPFPQLQLRSCEVEQYLQARQHWFDDLRGWDVRVALYNNPPRSLVFPVKGIYNGYALMLLREFLAYRRARFVPVLTPEYEVYSPNDCHKFLLNNQSDLCGDLLAYSSDLSDISYTASYTYLYGNILIPTAQQRSKNFYIVAPMDLTTWLLMLISVAAITSFTGFISYVQSGRVDIGQLLLEILCSWLSAGFQLRSIAGRLHYILFSTIFLAGFIYSNYYLAFLKTILSTGLYEPQINSFEELVQHNISFLVGDYDKTVLQTYDFPDILWNITRVVPYNFILDHRRVLDNNYAYLAHSDRLVLFNFQQHYMVKPRMRPLPIDLMHSLPGFPMRHDWLLKYKLSETLLNCFNSGLMQKLVADTNRQTIHIGYLPIITSEQFKARPLTLDYFTVPLYLLDFGVLLAFVCLLGEKIWHSVCRRRT